MALDVLARGRPEFLTRVSAYVEERSGWRGVPQARRALELASPRVRSPRETAFRLFWLDCGLARPEVNPRICTTDGWLLGLADLLDTASGLVGEYDGAGHRAEEQHVNDNVREESFEDAGLTVVRFGNLDLVRHLGRSRARLLAGLRRAESTPVGAWQWQPGPLPPPATHW